jgi:hypothetical protein
MDQKQFDTLLSDADTQLRRLRMLYDQWFMGIERLEPAIPRKELEDLLARLRKEQVTNTAARFRLQQLVARHMTYATHWRRIGRQIEEGTFKRDVLRARRQRRGTAERDYGDPELELSYDVDIDLELDAVLDEANRAAEDATRPRLQPVAAEALPETVPNHRPIRVNSTATRTFGPAPPLPAAGSGSPGELAAAAALSPPRLIVGPPAPPLRAPALSMPPGEAGAAAASVGAGAITGAAAPGASAGRAHRAISPFAMPPTPSGIPKPKPVEGHKPPPPPPLASHFPPALSIQPSKPGALTNGVAARLSMTGGLPSIPKAPAVPNLSRAPVAPRPVPSLHAQAAAPAAASGNGAFSPADVQRIYTQYLSARKQNAERVDNVKLDTIEKTIRGMLPQLEKKHAGKKIDFEVVMKDGKVALKPVAK